MNDLLKTASIACMALTISSGAALAADNPETIIKDGKFFGEVRYRYENVDQDGIADKANASTVRTNIGFETGKYEGFKALIEAQIVQNIGSEDFNDTTNGKTAKPVIADPDTTEINQLWLSYNILPDSVVKLGRQKIGFDNQRFVGGVNWRQNDQTYDAIGLTSHSIENLELTYHYISNVNRIQGNDHPLGDLDSNIHLARASYQFANWLTATGYGYWLDFDIQPQLSSKTFGIHVQGDTPINDTWSFAYEADIATQEDHANNTASYDEEYYHFAPTIQGLGWRFTLGYEVLGGDGTNSFQTPLATAHKYNGWADKFLSTPVDGLQDMYATIGYKASGIHDWIDGTKFSATYHDFEGDEDGDFGTEIDLSVGKTFTIADDGQPFKNISVLLKYADFDSEDAPYKDTQKFWLQIGTKF